MTAHYSGRSFGVKYTVTPVRNAAATPDQSDCALNGSSPAIQAAIGMDNSPSANAAIALRNSLNGFKQNPHFQVVIYGFSSPEPMVQMPRAFLICGPGHAVWNPFACGCNRGLPQAACRAFTASSC